MLITCPSCAAEYNTPATLAPGRMVRCAKCGDQWAPVARSIEPMVIDVVAEQVDPPAREIEAPAEPPSPIAKPVPDRVPRKTPLLLAWVASGLLIMALLAAAFVWREPVMRAWPPSIRVYAALGLTAHP